MSNTNPHSLQQTDLITDFRKILDLFDRETKIYKQQIDILKGTIARLEDNDHNSISNMTRELEAIRVILNNNPSNQPSNNSLPENALIGQFPNIQQQAPSQPQPQSTSQPQPQTPLQTPAQYNKSTNQNTRLISDYLCQICLDTPRDCILEPCMHFCLCARCVNLLSEPICPICRRPIDFYQNVFIS